MIMDNATRIYVVWGPTAEWGDGSGPLFYTDSFKSAASYVRDERKRTIDLAAQFDDTFASAEPKGITRDYAEACELVGWPDSQVSYWVECVTLGELWDSAWYGDDMPMPDSLDDVLESLNSY